MQALLEHSVQSYGPLPSELRPCRIRSCTSSRPSPYPQTQISKSTVSPMTTQDTAVCCLRISSGHFHLVPTWWPPCDYVCFTCTLKSQTSHRVSFVQLWVLGFLLPCLSHVLYQVMSESQDFELSNTVSNSPHYSTKLFSLCSVVSYNYYRLSMHTYLMVSEHPFETSWSSRAGWRCLRTTDGVSWYENWVSAPPAGAYW